MEKIKPVITVELIKEYADMGISYAEMARIWGLKYATLYHYVYRSRHRKGSQYRHTRMIEIIYHPEIDEIVKRLQQGFTIVSIVRKYGLSELHVRHIIKHFDIVVEPVAIATVIHPIHGIKEVFNISAFAREYGIHRTNASKLINQTLSSANGWVLVD